MVDKIKDDHIEENIWKISQQNKVLIYAKIKIRKLVKKLINKDLQKLQIEYNYWK